MEILCTFPGKHGDILWALPAVRALSRRLDTPITLMIPGRFGSLQPLLERQPYLDEVLVADWWEVQDTAPMTPRVPSRSMVQEWDYDLVLDLGYRGWPQRPLPFETLDCLNAQAHGACGGVIPDDALALDEPWITLPGQYRVSLDEVVVGFSDEHFETKVGLYDLLSHWFQLTPLVPPNSRWLGEWAIPDDGPGMDWMTCAERIRGGTIFVGCCSALHVLAIAVGKSCVIVEPAPARHHPIFWPLGTTGRVQLLLGGDGQPTVDARHLRDAVEKRLTGIGSSV